MVRAAARNLQAGGIEEGASTITQQYVRMALLDPEQTIDRKLHEIVWAVELEERLDKDEILERYLNGVYLGPGRLRVRDRRRSLLLQARRGARPGRGRAARRDDPGSRRHQPGRRSGRRQAAPRRRGRPDALQGFITPDEADAVLGSDLELDIAEPDIGEDAWVDLVKRLVYDPSADLQPGLQEAIGDSVQERVEALFEGGLTIETTLDGAHAGTRS
jgi:penicillin-binding protein 1A